MVRESAILTGSEILGFKNSFNQLTVTFNI
jgi:hypothetical protein